MKGSLRRIIGVLSSAALFVPAGAYALTETYGPSPYLSAADSPFVALNIPGFQLEDFEDGLLDTLGVTATTGGTVIGPQPQADSVDGDAGGIDGSGADGRSLLSLPDTPVLTFVFDAVALGGLPTHAGLVWTDVGFVTIPDMPAGMDSAVFEAFDQADQLIATIGPSALGDGSTFGATGEDRFFGVRHDAGIAKISITMLNSQDFEIDHLQYGIAAVPLPGTLLLLAPGVLAIAACRREWPTVRN